MLNINEVLNNKVMEVLGGNKEMTDKVISTVLKTMYEQARKTKKAVQVRDYKVAIFSTQNSMSNIKSSQHIHKVAIVGPDDNIFDKYDLKQRIQTYIENVIKRYGQAYFITCPGKNALLTEFVVEACKNINKQNKKPVAKSTSYIVTDNTKIYKTDVVFKSKDPIQNAINSADRVVLLADKENIAEHHTAIKDSLRVEASIRKNKVKKLFLHVNIAATETATVEDVKTDAVEATEPVTIKDIKTDTVEIKEENNTKEKTVKESVTTEKIDVKKEENNIIKYLIKFSGAKTKKVADLESKYRNIIKSYSKKDDYEKFLEICCMYIEAHAYKKGYCTGGCNLTSFKALVKYANKNGCDAAYKYFYEMNNISSPAGQD